MTTERPERPASGAASRERKEYPRATAQPSGGLTLWGQYLPNVQMPTPKGRYDPECPVVDRGPRVSDGRKRTVCHYSFLKEDRSG